MGLLLAAPRPECVRQGDDADAERDEGEQPEPALRRQREPRPISADAAIRAPNPRYCPAQRCQFRSGPLPDRACALNSEMSSKSSTLVPENRTTAVTASATGELTGKP